MAGAEEPAPVAVAAVPVTSVTRKATCRATAPTATQEEEEAGEEAEAAEPASSATKRGTCPASVQTATLAAAVEGKRLFVLPCLAMAVSCCHLHHAVCHVMSMSVR